jgi:hypothetical protein
LHPSLTGGVRGEGSAPSLPEALRSNQLDIDVLSWQQGRGVDAGSGGIRGRVRHGKAVEGKDRGQQLLVGQKLGSRHVQGGKGSGESLQQAVSTAASGLDPGVRDKGEEVWNGGSGEGDGQ